MLCGGFLCFCSYKIFSAEFAGCDTLAEVKSSCHRTLDRYSVVFLFEAVYAACFGVAVIFAGLEWKMFIGWFGFLSRSALQFACACTCACACLLTGYTSHFIYTNSLPLRWLSKTDRSARRSFSFLLRYTLWGPGSDGSCGRGKTVLTWSIICRFWRVEFCWCWVHVSLDASFVLVRLHSRARACDLLAIVCCEASS